MSKVTNSKLNRKLMLTKDNFIMPRPEVLSPEKREDMAEYWCHNPKCAKGRVIAAPRGTIVKYHKECREEARHYETR